MKRPQQKPIERKTTRSDETVPHPMKRPLPSNLIEMKRA
jgi:hypothetical protein